MSVYLGTLSDYATPRDPVAALPMQELTFDEVQKDPSLLSGGDQGRRNGDAQRRDKPSGSTGSAGKGSGVPKKRRPKKKRRTSDSDTPRSEQETNGGSGKQANASVAKKDRPVKAENRKGNEKEKSNQSTQPAKERSIQRTKDHKRMLEYSKHVELALLLERMETDMADDRKQATIWSETGSRKKIDQIERIGRQIQGLWQSTRPTHAQAAARAALVRDVDDALARRWPGCGLHVVPFGSTLTGLIEADSDVDLCLMDPTRPLGVGTPADQVIPLPDGARWEPLRKAGIAGMSNVPDYYNVRLIGNSALRHFSQQGKFVDIDPIQHANVPIVKFKHLKTGLECDLNVNDTFGLHNSEMIREYIEIAPAILKPFIFTIKKWASQRGINDPSGQSGMTTFNSYTIVLFALQYLQTAGIVPNLQEVALLDALDEPKRYLWQKPKGTGAIAAAANAPDENGSTTNATSSRIQVDKNTGARKFDTTFARLRSDDDVRLAEQVSGKQLHGRPFQMQQIIDQNEISVVLGTLLVGFFDWLYEFDFDQFGLSLRQGHPVRRKMVMQDESSERSHLPSWPYLEPLDARWIDSLILCQDPFILDRNTTAGIQKKGVKLIRQEIDRAFRLLKTANEDVLIDLLTSAEYNSLVEKQRSFLARLDPEQRLVFEDLLDRQRNTNRQLPHDHHRSNTGSRSTNGVKRKSAKPLRKSKPKSATATTAVHESAPA